MEKRKIVKEYKKDDLVVVWQPDLCIHSKNCINGLPAVFDFERRPWIDVSQESEDAIKKQIDKCPSGALSYYLQSEGKPQKENMDDSTKKIEILKDGPIMVEGPCLIKMQMVPKKKKPRKHFCADAEPLQINPIVMDHIKKLDSPINHL